MLKDFTAFRLSKEFYQKCKRLRMPTFLKDQLLRAASSIALNLAESNGNRTEKERIRFFTIALGSLRESQAILEIEEINDPELLSLTNQLGAILFTMCRLNHKKRETIFTKESAAVSDSEVSRRRTSD